MIEAFKEAISGQFEADFCTLDGAIERCPETDWDARIVDLTFNQAVFHTLFFTDVYLSRDLASLRGQAFHRENAAVLGDYEELEPRRQQASYTRAFLRRYVEHGRDKARATLHGEDVSELERRPGFDWLDISRAEVHIRNIRHLQHHAAQLSLWLKMRGDEGVEWVGSGWRES